MNPPADCCDPSVNACGAQVCPLGWQQRERQPTFAARQSGNNSAPPRDSFAGTRTPQPTKQPGTQPLPDNRHKLHTRTHYLERGQPTVATQLHSTNNPPTIFYSASEPAARNTRNPNVITLARFSCSKRAYTNYQFKMPIFQGEKNEPTVAFLPPVAC